MITQTEAGTAITGEHIGLYEMLSLKARLKLEGKGIKSRGPSALKLAKVRYGLQGSREKVLEQIESMIDGWVAKVEAETEE